VTFDFEREKIDDFLSCRWLRVQLIISKLTGQVILFYCLSAPLSIFRDSDRFLTLDCLYLCLSLVLFREEDQNTALLTEKSAENQLKESLDNGIKRAALLCVPLLADN